MTEQENILILLYLERRKILNKLFWSRFTLFARIRCFHLEAEPKPNLRYVLNECLNV